VTVWGNKCKSWLKRKFPGQARLNEWNPVQFKGTISHTHPQAFVIIGLRGTLLLEFIHGMRWFITEKLRDVALPACIEARQAHRHLCNICCETQLPSAQISQHLLCCVAAKAEPRCNLTSLLATTTGGIASIVYTWFGGFQDLASLLASVSRTEKEGLGTQRTWENEGCPPFPQTKFY
jgi:hypothetical protein